MATMMKEKTREKKKSKEKRVSKSRSEDEQSCFREDSKVSQIVDQVETTTIQSETIKEPSLEQAEAAVACSEELEQNVVEKDTISSSSRDVHAESSILGREKEHITDKTGKNVSTVETLDHIKVQQEIIAKTLLEASNVSNTYASLNSRLERVFMPNLQSHTVEVESQIESLNISQATEVTERDAEDQKETVFETALPSAPIFEEALPAQQTIECREERTKEVLLKQQCMSLEDAARLFGGKEMAEVSAMSEREEAIVEAGPVSGPEHPLVDLLSTFRTSLIVVERERSNVSTSITEEERFRNSLWKVEKKTMYASELCKCGETVELKAVFEHAEFLSAKLPVAKMKLERILRDVQESFCHHQHEALLAHCQIEELIYETMQSSKNELREALALVLQALRMSDNAPSALAIALERWATALSEALLDERDLRQLLHLLHHLFKQTRSVRWAARVVGLHVGDRSSAARMVAILQLLLVNPKLEAAVECTEETEDAWEEVGMRGGAGAVSEGSLRERDLLALLHALPVRDLVAKLALFARSDITQTRPSEWGDTTHGHDVLRACCGARFLLAIIHKAITTHTHYGRLRSELQRLASDVLHALAGLHLQCCDSYAKDIESKLQLELEAAFASGLQICAPINMHTLPATLLSEGAAMEYCGATIARLHESIPSYLEYLRMDVPNAPCGTRVRALAQAAVDRTLDNDLATRVLDFLLQCAVKRKTTACKGTCDGTAREMLSKLLTAHPYLHSMAIHKLADISEVEPLDPSTVKSVAPQLWRPSTGEVRAILDDWARRCAHLLPSLLLNMEYTPYCGVSLDSQIVIGSWLCHWSAQAPRPEWAWLVLRKLRTHRVWWALPLEAPPYEGDAKDAFAAAYAVLATDWGHCIPLICSLGVAALQRLAAARPADAAHCLSPLVVVMSTSPESISLTPQFKELFATLLDSGPTLVQRALGRGPQSGADLLLKLILAHLDGRRPAVISRSALTTAWLHALGTHALMDTAVLAAREWAQLDAYVTGLMQEENYNEHLTQAVRNAHQAPLICECVLRTGHAQRESPAQLWPRLLDVLHTQRITRERIHVDNALKLIGAAMSAEDLIINRTATAVLTAPLQHPAHLTLWRLFFHLYLQRPPKAMHESTRPCGPLFFTGLFKSRTLGYLKKRLQEAFTHHHGESEALKSTSTSKQIPTPPEPTSSKVAKTPKSDAKIDEVLPALSIRDLTGESSESESESSEESGEEKEIEMVAGVTEKDVYQLFCYHVAAEKMILEYSRWLEEGDKVLAMPHHADIARFIPEQALDAAWAAELSRRQPAAAPADQEPPLPPTAPPPQSPPPPTPLTATVERILKIRDGSRRRLRRPTIKSALENVSFTDIRQLTRLVDRHLDDMESLAQEWSKEVSRISSLDSQLWQLVCGLRVRRPLPSVPKQCRANKCRPVPVRIQADEWCISTGAQQGITTNRAAAHASLRRLSRARPNAARTAAALHTIARRISNKESAVRVCERVWRCASVPACPLVATALTQVMTDLAEKWLCADGRLCAELLSQWSGSAGSALHGAMCGALVSPRRMRGRDCATVYAAVLRASLPPDAAFSYLSKFEMARWSENMEPAQRRDILQALLSAAQRWGVKPDEEHGVLLELIGVHAATILNPTELCPYISSCARASSALRLPPAHWPHVSTAVRRDGALLPFDQLGHLLRELGVIWWEARTRLKSGRTQLNYELYAKEFTELLQELQRAFVAAGVGMSYTPDRVSVYAWSGLLESWAPWITPHAAIPPLLTSIGEQESFTEALEAFVRTIRLVMADCPGSDDHLLQQSFEWAIQTHLASCAGSQECRVQTSALLVQLAGLPWHERQWLSGSAVNAALQICATPDKELHAWCSAALRGTTAHTFARICDTDDCALRLAALLRLFTSIPLAQSTLDEATRLQWWRLPEVALDEALDFFFMQHHSPAQPYHELPQFRVVLFAGELCLFPDTAHAQTRVSRDKRARLVSTWTRAAAQPALCGHVRGHTEHLLRTLTDVAPYLEHSPGEIEELLSRAVIMMCMEPAAAAALPVWQSWVASTTRRMAGASVSAVAVLTAFEYYAALADSAAKALLAHADSGGWTEISHRWQSSPWREATSLISRGRLYAAYASTRTHPHSPDDVRATVLALMNASVNFVENESIIAVWICCACRLALAAGDTGAWEECRAICRALLAKWGEEPRRSLLRVVTMQQDTAAPTAQHRLLSRLATCITSPSEASARAYETTCLAILGSTSDALAWGKAPTRKRLPRLAVRLYPSFEKYFKDELDLAPED